ncbi:hypothetical protein HZH68_003373 [Vespula germanica]|uniref:Uncharacterized protein n=1 Tax=Vespula germanica TaxID=30212 RepID=A0A834U346_VESGE|nr:hypothetical protein HZH68_003373 [Vespula germanica]
MPRLREYAGFIEFQRGTTKRDGIWHSSYHVRKTDENIQSAFLEDTIAGESKCQGNSSGRPRYDDCKEVGKKEKDEEEEEEDEEEDEEDRRRISSFYGGGSDDGGGGSGDGGGKTKSPIGNNEREEKEQ